MCLISFRFSCFNSVPYSNMYCCVLQAWSITYHSWLTFVLLLAACFIWMVPQSRKACLLCSPAVVLYGEVLLIIQFVYGMNLTELPEESNGIKLDEIGLKKFKYPCLQLALQVNTNTTQKNLNVDEFLFISMQNWCIILRKAQCIEKLLRKIH